MIDKCVVMFIAEVDCFLFSCLDNDTSCISDTEDTGDCAVYNNTSSCPSEYHIKINF